MHFFLFTKPNRVTEQIKCCPSSYFYFQKHSLNICRDQWGVDTSQNPKQAICVLVQIFILLFWFCRLLMHKILSKCQPSIRILSDHEKLWSGGRRKWIMSKDLEQRGFQKVYWPAERFGTPEENHHCNPVCRSFMLFLWNI